MQNSQNSTDNKFPIYAIGAAIGLLLGFISAHLFMRAVQEHNEGIVPKVETTDIFKLGLAGIALMRQITDLAAKGNSRRK